MLLRAAVSHPDRHLTVLCGPTHVAADVYIRPNLHVLVGAAEYRALQVVKLIDRSRAAGRLSEKFTERVHAKGNARDAAGWGLANDNSLVKTVIP
jgi:hypothetical protein